MISRRDFIGAALLATGASVTGCQSLAGRRGIIDTHTHFYDPTRPQGVSWPAPDDSILYRPVLPAEYRSLAEPLGITGTVVVEASPREDDNEWVLELAARDKFIVGLVGYLKPGEPRFAGRLKGLARNPLFRGIRVGAWNKGLHLKDRLWMADLNRLADLDLALDVLVEPGQMLEVAQLAAAFPKLRIVVDHSGNIRMGPVPLDPAWLSGIVACHSRENVFMKMSGFVEGSGRPGAAPREGDLYRPVMNTLWEAFGEDRLIFGSNWPVSARFASLDRVVGLVQDFVQPKGQSALDKVFRQNAVKVYRF
jgi:L-fuconolactonase